MAAVALPPRARVVDVLALGRGDVAAVTARAVVLEEVAAARRPLPFDGATPARLRHGAHERLDVAEDGVHAPRLGHVVDTGERGDLLGAAMLAARHAVVEQRHL